MFISLEGIDRSGKTTQAAMLAEALGPETLLVREPGGTEAGERIRELVRDPGVELGARAELMLFLAARAELADRIIAPARAGGRDVVCDRYVDSTAAYQGAAVGALRAAELGGGPGAARELGIELIEELNAVVVGDCMPDLTVLVRVSPAAAAERRRAGEPGAGDRFEARGLDYQREVATAYEALAARHGERIVVVDGEGPPEAVHANVLAAVEERR